MDEDVQRSGVLGAVYACPGSRNHPLLPTYTTGRLAFEDIVDLGYRHSCNRRAGRDTSIVDEDMAKKILVEGGEQ